MPPQGQTVQEGIMSGDLEPVGETTALHHRFWEEDPSRLGKSRGQHHKTQQKSRYQDEATYRDDVAEDGWR